jgi:hypothetical protein
MIYFGLGLGGGVGGGGAFGSGFGNGGQSLRLVSSSLCIRSCLGLKPVRENVFFPLQHGSFVIGKRRGRFGKFATMIR